MKTTLMSKIARFAVGATFMAVVGSASAALITNTYTIPATNAAGGNWPISITIGTFDQNLGTLTSVTWSLSNYYVGTVTVVNASGGPDSGTVSASPTMTVVVDVAPPTVSNTAVNLVNSPWALPFPGSQDFAFTGSSGPTTNVITNGAEMAKFQTNGSTTMTLSVNFSPGVTVSADSGIGAFTTSATVGGSIEIIYNYDDGVVTPEPTTVAGALLCAFVLLGRTAATRMGRTKQA